MLRARNAECPGDIFLSVQISEFLLMLEKLPEDEQREAVRILQNWMDMWKVKRGISRYKGDKIHHPTDLYSVCMLHVPSVCSP